ncbi:MAG: hypothetical protein AAFO91_16075 [Bacteroidota bacterium]
MGLSTSKSAPALKSMGGVEGGIFSGAGWMGSGVGGLDGWMS